MPNILIVEDDEMNRDMLSRRLLRKGFEVQIAIDGVEGVAMAQTAKPDLILMDMSLPKMSGWEAASAIKGNPLVSFIPIIALTAHAMESDRQRALQSGCDDYDTKPIELPRLLEKMDRLLAAKSPV
jgi:two-component system cell cycle response regulator DivK